eukprot:jgi/Mesen1/3867/ME000207S02877
MAAAAALNVALSGSCLSIASAHVRPSSLSPVVSVPCCAHFSQTSTSQSCRERATVSLGSSFGGQCLQLSSASRKTTAKRSRVISNAVPEISEADFESEVLNSSVPVLVDFWASWCGPCKLVLPIVEWASKEYDGKLKVVKIETDGNPKLVEKYKVYGLPAMLIFQDGDKVAHNEGAINKAKLQALLVDKLPDLAVAE